MDFLLFFAGGYVVVPEKLPNYVVPDLTNFKVQEFYNIGCLSGWWLDFDMDSASKVSNYNLVRRSESTLPTTII